MVIYLLYVASPILIYFLFGLFRNQTNKNQGININAYLFVCGIIMALMIGLRHPHNGSGDTYRYCQNWILMRGVDYDNLASTLDNIDFEKGYLVFVWLLTRIFYHPQWLLVLTGVFFSVTVCYFVKFSCDGSPLALMAFNSLGLFAFMVQGLRQSIAMCLCLWALECLKRGKCVKTILLIILASTFHASALVFFIVFPLSKLKINFKSFVIVLVGATVAAFLLPNLFELVNSWINDDYGMGQGAESGGVVAILIYFVIIVFGLLVGDKNEKYFPLYIYMAIVAIACMIMRNSVSTIVERIAQYFAFGQMAVLALRSVKKSSDYEKVTSKEFKRFILNETFIGKIIYKRKLKQYKDV
jgi:hypothetical protein